MNISDNERLILSDFYRKQVIRLRKEIQEIIEKSYSVESVFINFVNQNFYFENDIKYKTNKEKNYFYALLEDSNGNIIYSPKYSIQPKDVISFKMNVPQLKGECSFITEVPFNKEEIVCLMSIFNLFNDLLNIISEREVKKRIPNVLMEIISRASLEMKDQIQVLNEILKEAIQNDEASNDFLFRYNIIFQNMINTVERIGLMSQSYLGIIDNYSISNIIKSPVKLKKTFEEALSMLPTDIDKEKFSIYIDDNIIINIDEDKLRYAIANILSYGNRKSDHITIYTELLHKGEDVVISIVFSGVRLDEKEILSLDENVLKGCIEIASTIEFIIKIFNGKFWIDNSQSKGATLSISLPLD